MTTRDSISGGVVHDLPADLKAALKLQSESTGDVGGYYTARPQRVDLLDRDRQTSHDES
jgi:hypothetical protein